MGSSRKSTGSTNQNTSGTSTIDYKPASGAETQLLNQFRQLGDNQLSFLTSLMNGGVSPYQLGSADQAQLDKSYQSAFDRFNLEGKDYADYLATTRGLNKSDTPVSQQAMERYGLGMADLLSQKANAGLNLGLQATGLRMQGLGALPSGMSAAFQPLFSERMASPTTTSRGNMTGHTTQIYQPSMMDNIGQGMGLAKQGLGLIGQIGSMGAGFMTGGLGGAFPMPK